VLSEHTGGFVFKHPCCLDRPPPHNSIKIDTRVCRQRPEDKDNDTLIDYLQFQYTAKGFSFLIFTVPLKHFKRVQGDRTCSYITEKIISDALGKHTHAKTIGQNPKKIICRPLSSTKKLQKTSQKKFKICLQKYSKKLNAFKLSMVKL